MSELETIEVFGPKGRAIINLCDLITYRAKGYRLANEPEPPKRLDEMTVAELKEIAEKAEVELAGLTKKADILAAIEKAQDEANIPKE